MSGAPRAAASAGRGGSGTLPADPAAGGDPGCPVCGCGPARPHPGLPSRAPGLLLAWLAGNYHRPGLRAGEMAAAAGLSVRRLQFACQREWGRTPFQLLAGICLHRARLALTSSVPAPGSVAEVARSAGFTRVSRFRAACPGRYGMPPAITIRGAGAGDLPGMALVLAVGPDAGGAPGSLTGTVPGRGAARDPPGSRPRVRHPSRTPPDRPCGRGHSGGTPGRAAGLPGQRRPGRPAARPGRLRSRA
jgi:AraC-like DNA-binding protein